MFYCFNAVVNETDFLTFYLDILLLVYRSADFCMWIMGSANLLGLFIRSGAFFGGVLWIFFI